MVVQPCQTADRKKAVTERDNDFVVVEVLWVRLELRVRANIGAMLQAKVVDICHFDTRTEPVVQVEAFQVFSTEAQFAWNTDLLRTDFQCLVLKCRSACHVWMLDGMECMFHRASKDHRALVLQMQLDPMSNEWRMAGPLVHWTHVEGSIVD